MNKQDLVAAVAAEADLTKADAARAVNAVFSSIEGALKDGDACSFVGFGSFKVRRRDAQTVRNPRDGKPLKVPARNVPKFVPGKALKEAVN